MSKENVVYAQRAKIVFEMQRQMLLVVGRDSNSLRTNSPGKRSPNMRNNLCYTFIVCCRMEETVKNMLVYKTRSEQLKQEKTALALAFEVIILTRGCVESNVFI